MRGKDRRRERKARLYGSAKEELGLWKGIKRLFSNCNCNCRCYCNNDYK